MIRRALAILAVLLIVGCAGAHTGPPHGKWIVENQGVRYWMYWCPHHGKLLIDGTIIPEQSQPLQLPWRKD